MDLALFKLRYPSFVNDIEIQMALDDASLMISVYDIDENIIPLAVGLMAAHLLTLKPDLGASERLVTKVKADTVEVEFSDKVAAIDTWLQSTKYGLQLELLIRGRSYNREYGFVNNYERYAINYYGYEHHDKEPCNLKFSQGF